MDVDPSSQDPDLQIANFLAIASASLGLLSICLAIIPVCGGVASILAVVLGLYSLKTEHSKTAIVGVTLATLGILITIVYTLFLLFIQS